MRNASLLLTRMVLTLLAIIYSALPVVAQSSSEAAGPTLDAATRMQVVETVLQKLNETYVFPEVAHKMAASLRERMRNKEYDGISDGKRFAERLTNDLQAVSHDKHLEVYYNPTSMSKYKEPTPAEQVKMREDLRKRGEAANWGFDRVERLSGNIGYLKLRFFIGPEFAGETLAQSMGFLANTEALILDLRDNGGGDPMMVALVCSYFFSGDPVHLSDLYWHPDKSTQQFWTLPYVPGKQYVGKDVYILTGKETLSAAEGFTYDLQTQKRATVIGETTGGYAHPGSSVPINTHFGIVIPQGRMINVITKTDWEGVGVTPDVRVPAAQALQTAHLMALKKALERETDDQRKAELKEALKKAESRQNLY